LFDLVVQVLNLGPADLRASVEKVLGKEFMQMIDKAMAFGEKAMAFGEKALEPVAILFSKGPGALWEHIKDQLGGIIRSSFDRIRESVFNTFVEKALKWIAGFFIPGGGFVKIVKAIFRAFQFVAENLERIRLFFDSVFDSMEAATQGRTEGVASKIITGLKMGIVLALDFLAKQLGLDKIVDGVQKIIQSIRRPIVSAVEWVLGKAKPFVVKVGRAVATQVKAGISKVAALVFPKKKLVLPDGTHTLEVEEEASGYEVVVYSNRMTIAQIITRGKNKGVDVSALEAAYKTWRALPGLDHPKDLSKPADKAAYEKRSAAYEEVFETAREVMDDIFGTNEVTKIEWYGLDSEGRAKGLKADPLTKKGPKGSPPAENIPGWDQDLKYDGEKIAYIKTHLLHHDLSGPGRGFNLTPTSDRYNKTILHEVEKDSLEAVNKRGDELSYVVNVVYEEPKLSQLNKVTPSTKRGLLRYVAKKVNLTVTKKKDGKRLAYLHNVNNYD
jgi:hypothetical protein